MRTGRWWSPWRFGLGLIIATVAAAENLPERVPEQVPEQVQVTHLTERTVVEPRHGGASRT